MPQVRAYFSGFRFWLIWNVAAVCLLYAKPWGAFGWDELAVCAAPLLLLRPSMRRVNVLSIGLVVSSLAWITTGDQSGGWPELAYLGAVLVGGIMIGDAANRAEAARKTQSPDVTSLANAGDLFLFLLGRELSRAPAQ